MDLRRRGMYTGWCMTCMFFDSTPEPPRDVWVHSVKGWIVGLRVKDKAYPVLPSLPVKGDFDARADALVRAVYEQTGLVVSVRTLAHHVGDDHDSVWTGSVVAGTLRASSAGTPELIHPIEFRCSPDFPHIVAEGLFDEPPPLVLESVSVRPEDIIPGDRTALPITGVRVEHTDSGHQVFVQYESFAQGTLGADDELYGEEPTTKEEDDAKGKGKRASVRLGDAALGRVWTPLQGGGANLLVHRLGGLIRGPKT